MAETDSVLGGEALTDEERKTLVGFLTAHCSVYLADQVMQSILRKIGGVGKQVLILTKPRS